MRRIKLESSVFIIQWNASNADTIGTAIFVLYREVSLCLHALLQLLKNTMSLQCDEPIEPSRVL